MPFPCFVYMYTHNNKKNNGRHMDLLWKAISKWQTLPKTEGLSMWPGIEQTWTTCLNYALLISHPVQWFLIYIEKQRCGSINSVIIYASTQWNQCSSDYFTCLLQQWAVSANLIKSCLWQFLNFRWVIHYFSKIRNNIYSSN